jgi:hypothetical protein
MIFPRFPIVDTGPLFDFLLWQFSESIGNPKILIALEYIKSEPYRKAVRWYFRVARPIRTCPQVLAEIHRHAQKIRGLNLGVFWKFAQRELSELGLKEQLIELIHMPSDTLASFGPTDTALIQIAFGLPSQPVFTEDTRLAVDCRRKQISVLSIAEVTALWQQFGSK